MLPDLWEPNVDYTEHLLPLPITTPEVPRQPSLDILKSQLSQMMLSCLAPLATGARLLRTLLNLGEAREHTMRLGLDAHTSTLCREHLWATGKDASPRPGRWGVMTYTRSERTVIQT